jgi:hypothetical protein
MEKTILYFQTARLKGAAGLSKPDAFRALLDRHMENL